MKPGLTGRMAPFHLGLAFGLAWWALMLLGLKPSPPSVPAVSAGRAAVAYMPVQSFSPPERPDVRAIWSPVLFSLPTPAGFSRDVPAGPAARPPLDPAVDPPPLLDRRAATPSGTTVALPPVPLPPVRLSPVPPRPSPAPASLAALEGEIPAGAAFPVPPESRGRTPWEAEARVAFDDSGLPVHAFVESGEVPPAVRAEIPRGLLRWRRNGGPAGWVALRISHPGPGPGEGAP